MPGAPAAMHARAASTTLGICPPREFLIVATLLTLTDSFAMSEARELGGSEKHSDHSRAIVI
jgi:hypothetical protein